MRARPSETGFTYLGLLCAVVIMALMLTVVGRVWQTTIQREREAQLIWVGDAYRMAIASYFSVGHQFPVTLQQLLIDDRFPVAKHHLRRLYPDPMTGEANWTLLLTANQTGIQGVASTSQQAPMKRDGFALADATFKDAECYCQWKFIYVPRRWMPGGAQGAGQLPGAPVPGTPAPGSPGGAPGVAVPAVPQSPAPGS